MKIERTYIKDNELFITLDKTAQITKIYLDVVSNKANMYSEEDSDHTYVIDSVESSGKTEYVVDITDFKESAFIVTVVSTEKDVALAIDEQELYYAKVNMLLSFCSTCLDKDREYKIVLCELRSNLLKEAQEKKILIDAIQHYIDLTRILEISNGVEHECSGCKTGYCAL